MDVGDWQLIRDIITSCNRPFLSAAATATAAATAAESTRSNKVAQPTKYKKSAVAKMRQYDLKVYPKALIDIYWKVNNQLNSTCIATSSWQQEQVVDFWMSLADVHYSD